MASSSGPSTYSQPAYTLDPAETVTGIVPSNFAFVVDEHVDPRRYGADPTNTYSATAQMTNALAVGANTGTPIFIGTNTYQSGSVLNGLASVNVAGNKWVASTSSTQGMQVTAGSGAPAMTLLGTSGNNTLVVEANGFDGTSAGLDRALMLFGKPNTYTQELVGSATSGQSYGLLMSAGSTSADIALLIKEKTATTTLFRVRGDGQVFVGGPGSIASPSVLISAGDYQLALNASGAGADAKNWSLRSGGSFALSTVNDAGNTNQNALIITRSGITPTGMTAYGPNAATQVDLTPDSATVTCTITGCTTAPTGTMTLKKVGALVVALIPGITGTSNSTALTFTCSIPSAFRPAGTRWVPVPAGIAFDAGAHVSDVSMSLDSAGTTLTFYRTLSASGFTNTATTKGISNGFFTSWLAGV